MTALGVLDPSKANGRGPFLYREWIQLGVGLAPPTRVDLEIIHGASHCAPGTPQHHITCPCARRHQSGRIEPRY